MDPVDLGAVEPASEKTFSHDFIIPETHVSSQLDDPDIVVTYSLLVKVEPNNPRVSIYTFILTISMTTVSFVHKDPLHFNFTMVLSFWQLWKKH